MTDSGKHIAFNDGAEQTAYIIATLQEVLVELDRHDLSVPAIKIAEAIDYLEQA